MVSIPLYSSSSQEELPEICDFEDSVVIIEQLIYSNTLATILEDADPCAVDLLIKNFSPAELAVESEILSCTMPVLIYFYGEDYYKNNPDIIQIAHEFHDVIKVVRINCNKFYKLYGTLFDMFPPAIILMYERKEIGWLETFNFEQLKQLIQQTLHI